MSLDYDKMRREIIVGQVWLWVLTVAVALLAMTETFFHSAWPLLLLAACVVCNTARTSARAVRLLGDMRRQEATVELYQRLGIIP